MPEITGLTPLNVMLLECGKKELYNWTLAQLWTYLDKMGYDLYIDAIPQKQEKTPLPPNTVLAAVCSVSQPASKTRNKKSRPTQKKTIRKTELFSPDGDLARQAHFAHACPSTSSIGIITLFQIIINCLYNAAGKILIGFPPQFMRQLVGINGITAVMPGAVLHKSN